MNQETNAVSKVDDKSYVLTKEEMESAVETEMCDVKPLTNDDKLEPDAETQGKLKKWWTRYETLALIHSVEVHYPKLRFQKKSMWKNVSSDLHKLNIEVTPKECMIKWKNLIRSYINVKETRERTGRGPLKFQYFYEVNNIMGPKLLPTPPLNKSTEDSQKRIQLTADFLKLKEDEWKKRQLEWEKRHQEKEEKISLQKQKLELEAKKVELLELYLSVKEKEARRIAVKR